MSKEQEAELTSLMLGRTAPDAASAVLAAGWFKPYEVTTDEELHGLNHEAIIRDTGGDILVHVNAIFHLFDEKRVEHWVDCGYGEASTPTLPATVLYEGVAR